MSDSIIFGVMLSYYPHYLDAALTEFIAILSSISHNYKVIVVNNNPDGNSLKLVDDHVVVIDGDNSSWEFSGWHVGLKYIKQTEHFSNANCIIFANDTLNKHRIFSFVDRKLFVNSIKSMPKTRPAICGELNAIGANPESFSIYMAKANGWISSYLYALNRPMLLRLDQFDMKSEFDRALLKYNQHGFQFDSLLVSQNLSDYIRDWLFPDVARHGWYGSSRIAAGNVELLKNKLRAILNEKFLSANCVASGGVLVDVYAGRAAKLYQYVMRKLNTITRLWG